jgi:hypothetical protein
MTVPDSSSTGEPLDPADSGAVIWINVRLVDAAKFLPLTASKLCAEAK